MIGQEAVLYAVEDAGVGTITYVPGYPITELAAGLKAEISVNEKVAMEIALGASATGCRSMAVVKQVGMNLLADPLAVSSFHSVGSGVVVIAGDDLGPRGSQVEMDSRLYGLVAELPVLDPRDPANLYRSLMEAYQVSERFRVPVIVRVTWRLLSTEAPEIQRIPATAEARGFSRRRLDNRESDSRRFEGRSFDWTNWDLTARGRGERHRKEVLAQAARISETTPLNDVQYCAEVGIVASGYPAFLAAGLGASLLAVAYAHPLPWKLVRKFIAAHRWILVAEEPCPLIESWLQMSPKVRGRLTGHLPFGPLEISDLKRALESISWESMEWPETDQELTRSRGVVCEPTEPTSADAEPLEGPCSYELAAERGYLGVCQGCPFADLFTALGRLEVPVAGDVGCVIRAARPPYQSVDVAYGLGSSVGVASGFGKKGIAVIGDFALAHSGLQGLINALWRKRNLLVVLLKNDIAATTGGQEAPDLTGLLERLLPLQRLRLPASEEDIEKLLEEELARPGVSAIVACGSCIEHKHR
jgi:indolepyruvate ferredoxin oxidoreductase alpha subunit